MALLFCTQTHTQNERFQFTGSVSQLMINLPIARYCFLSFSCCPRIVTARRRLASPLHCLFLSLTCATTAYACAKSKFLYQTDDDNDDDDNRMLVAFAGRSGKKKNHRQTDKNTHTHTHSWPIDWFVCLCVHDSMTEWLNSTIFSFVCQCVIKFTFTLLFSNSFHNFYFLFLQHSGHACCHLAPLGSCCCCLFGHSCPLKKHLT